TAADTSSDARPAELQNGLDNPNALAGDASTTSVTALSAELQSGNLNSLSAGPAQTAIAPLAARLSAHAVVRPAASQSASSAEPAAARAIAGVSAAPGESRTQLGLAVLRHRVQIPAAAGLAGSAALDAGVRGRHRVSSAPQQLIVAGMPVDLVGGVPVVSQDNVDGQFVVRGAWRRAFAMTGTWRTPRTVPGQFGS
ncbi:MAG: hypothetical protein AAFU66_07825, partial [Pseudomonadota bacterium]